MLGALRATLAIYCFSWRESIEWESKQYLTCEILDVNYVFSFVWNVVDGLPDCHSARDDSRGSQASRMRNIRPLPANTQQNLYDNVLYRGPISVETLSLGTLIIDRFHA